MEDGPPIFRQDTTCPALLIELTACAFFVYGAVTLYRAPFQTLPLTHTLIQALGCSPFARRYWGISVDFFSSGYLDVSVPPVRLINLWIQLMIVCRNTLGFPIRKSPVITVHITLPTLIAD